MINLAPIKYRPNDHIAGPGHLPADRRAVYAEDRMPLVTTCFWLPEEEPAFLDYLRATGDVFFAPFGGAERRPAADLRSLARLPAADELSDVVLTTATFADYCKTTRTETDTGVIWYVNWFDSCVVVYSRPQLKRRELTPINYNAYVEYPFRRGDETGPKPMAFVNWAKRLNRWIRRSAPVMYEPLGLRASRAVIDAVAEGRVRLAKY
jgi:hypothetical protein